MYNRQAKTSGKCGENLTWKYENGWLYIDGSGAMTFDKMPWHAWKDEIEGVDLQGGCTSICAKAFSNCEKLNVVLMPDHLEYIGESAFENCGLLGSLVWPVGDTILNEVADCAFRNCRSLSGWDAKIKVIGKRVFDHCAQPPWDWYAIGYENQDIVRLGRSPIALGDPGCYKGAVVAAYGGVCWHQTPAQGMVIEATVVSPFCCQIGDLFHAVCTDSVLITAKLVSIVSSNENSACVCVEILEVKDARSFVQPVSAEEKMRMKEQHSYEYPSPGPGSEVICAEQIDERMMRLISVWDGGDFQYQDSIYTDDDGIDHLILSQCRHLNRHYAYAGDAVLGFRADCPWTIKSHL